MFNLFKPSKKIDFKFKESEKTLCFTCNHVINRERPILYVTHDADDGTWQFMCGKNDHDSTNVKMVSLLNIITIDSTVNDLYEMPVGYGAEREAATDKWKPFKNK